MRDSNRRGGGKHYIPDQGGNIPIDEFQVIVSLFHLTDVVYFDSPRVHVRGII